MKSLYVNQLVIGQKVVAEQFQVVAAEEKKTKANKPYLALKVRDKTGEVSGNKWGMQKGDMASCALGSIVYLTGKVEEYPAGCAQLNIDSISAVLDCDPDDFIPVAAKSHNELCEDVKRLIEAIEDPWLKKLVQTVLGGKDGYMFRQWPAAKSVHHATKHGLLQHSVEVAQFADAIFLVRGEHGYPESINRSLVIAGALLHDIGKIDEYVETQNGAFDVGEGGLHGHIMSGSWEIIKAAQKCGSESADTTEDNAKSLSLLLHIIASHHALLEHGSPVQPMIPEAIIVHIGDLTSAKLYTDWDARQKHTGTGLYAKHIDGRAFCPKQL